MAMQSSFSGAAGSTVEGTTWQVSDAQTSDVVYEESLGDDPSAPATGGIVPVTIYRPSTVVGDSKTPSTVYVLYTDTSGGQIAKSVDGGATWQVLTSALPPPSFPACGIQAGAGCLAHRRFRLPPAS